TSSLGGLRPETATRMPSARSRAAIVAPKPEVPPVTRATRADAVVAVMRCPSGADGEARTRSADVGIAVGERATCDGRTDGDGGDLARGDLARVGAEEDHVGQLAGHEPALARLLARDRGRADGGGVDGLVDRDALVLAVDAA